MLADVKYALRTFAKRPSFVLGAVTTLALAVAVNTIVFSLFNALVLRPMPVPRADRVVRLSPIEADGRTGNKFSYPDVVTLASRAAGAFDTVSAYVPAEVTAGRSSLDRDAVPPRSALAYVTSSSYFDITGLRAVRGRTLTASDDSRAARAIVISHAFWRQRFGAAENIVGATLTITGEPFVVVGVAEPKFAGTEPIEADLWLPVSAVAIATPERADFLDGNARSFLAIGRLRDGISHSQAAAAADVVLRGMSDGGRVRPVGATVTAGTFFKFDPALGPVIATTFGVVGLVLLIACGNVANLMLARALARQREIAVRLAIGASRLRIIRQLIVEAVLLGMLAGGAGLLISTWTLRVLYTTAIAMLPFTWTVSLTLAPDARVFAYTLAIATLASVAFGLAPALHAVRPDILPALNGTRLLGGARMRGRRLRDTLVVVQVAGSLALAIGAGLLLRGLRHAEALDLGFDTRGVVYADFELDSWRYHAPRAAAFNAALQQRVAALPAVTGTALTSHVPLHGGVRRITVRLLDTPGAPSVDAELTVASPGYFGVLGVPLVAGRNFADDESQGAAVVISEGLARRFWPGQAALGRVITSSSFKGPRTVVGVVRDAVNTAIWREKELSIYLPFDATRDPREVSALIVRGDGDPSSLRSAIADAAATIDPDLRVTVTPLDQLLRLWLMPSRVAAAAAATLAALALLLASFGLYAVLTFTVSERLREIGIRMALGATARDVARLVVTDGMRLLGAGLAIGCAGAIAAAPFLGRLLFGVRAFDPITLGAVSLLLAVIGAAASYIPIRRATALPPLSVLRVE